MADRSTEIRWLEQLTSIPSVPGREEGVMEWVRRWVGRRADLTAKTDRSGNLLITQKGRKQAAPVIAVAHTDHPGFVVIAREGREVTAEFRGGVRPQYFEGARVEFLDAAGRAHRHRLDDYAPEQAIGRLRVPAASPLAVGDIGRWALPATRRTASGLLQAPACDDLAGVAAALSALDRARGEAARRHFGVLLTRAEEVGFVGAIGAARDGTLPPESRVLSIECSRAFADSPIGGGPVVRVGDASSVFHHDLTNRVADAVKAAGIRHQRKLMAGGSCEATAFLAYGYSTTGLCLPLGNYHNMGNLDQVERGQGPARIALEEVSLDDYAGLVDLLGVATTAVDGDWDLVARLDARFERERYVLG